MMTREQYLLVKLAEEASEVAQRALKASQFGVDEVQKGQEQNNAERLYDELNDLNGILALLNSHVSGFAYTPDPEAIKAKRNKLKKYKKLAATYGKVTDEDV